MKPNNISQEILLFTGTSFASREYCSNAGGDKAEKTYSTHEKLEKACWDGLIYEMLPELDTDEAAKRECFIWQISSADNFLCINSGIYHEYVEQISSIDPYYFITVLNIN